MLKFKVITISGEVLVNDVDYDTALSVASEYNHKVGDCVTTIGRAN